MIQMTCSKRNIVVCSQYSIRPWKLWLVSDVLIPGAYSNWGYYVQGCELDAALGPIRTGVTAKRTAGLLEDLGLDCASIPVTWFWAIWGQIPPLFLFFQLVLE